MVIVVSNLLLLPVPTPLPRIYITGEERHQSEKLVTQV